MNSRLMIATSVLVASAGLACAGIIPVSASYSGSGSASAEGVFVSEIDSDSFAFGQEQPAGAPLGSFGQMMGVETDWVDASFPSNTSSGDSAASINASAPSPITWGVGGWARADVTGDLAAGALGKGRASATTTLNFMIDEPTLVRLSGFVIGREFVHPSWVNFEEQSTVELWQGATLLHTFSGVNEGLAVPFDVTGLLSAGSYRLEAWARARTESLPGAQPFHPASAFEATMTVVPSPGAPMLAVLCVGVLVRRRREL
jgi:hypothetical protein